MNTTSDTILVNFNPETAFQIPARALQTNPDSNWENRQAARFGLPSEQDFLRGGIPESALHD
jgi:hypothetical protein